jgi:hypothetical protein
MGWRAVDRPAINRAVGNGAQSDLCSPLVDSSLGFAASPLSHHFGETFDTKRNMRL